MGYSQGILRGNAVTALQSLGNDRRGERTHLDELRPRPYGTQHPLGVVAHQQEDTAGIGLLEQLEQLVGTGIVHALGQPDNHDFIGRLVALQRHLAQDALALLAINHGLLVLGIDVAQPRVDAEIGMFFQELAPLGQIVVADAFLLLDLDNGKDKMQVGMREGRILLARRAHPAGIALLAVGTVYIAGIGHGHGKLAYPLGTAQQLGMGYVAAVDRTQQPLFHLVLPDYIFEKHIAFSPLFSFNKPAWLSGRHCRQP